MVFHFTTICFFGFRITTSLASTSVALTTTTSGTRNELVEIKTCGTHSMLYIDT
jgi:hypothetical protein